MSFLQQQQQQQQRIPYLRKSKTSIISVQSLLTHGMFGLICWYLGVLVGMSNNKADIEPASKDCLPCQCPCPCPSSLEQQAAASSESYANRTFPPTLSNMFVDFATVDRLELSNLLDIGVPMDDTKTGAEDALLLYTSSRSKPSYPKTRAQTQTSKYTATQAVENCRTVKVILMEPTQKHSVPECLAILPQWESYYVHKFMRLPPGKGPINPKAPLRYVSRSHDVKGTFSAVPDYRLHTEPSYETLVDYLQHLDEVLNELKPLLELLLKVSSNPKSKTIIVQVCNYGQVELFANYICNAKSKGLDFSHIFLFATDLKTYELCQAYGIPAYYNEAIFGDMPELAARGYGDKIFRKMMMAKVYCVHLVLSLGYNVLFQDVDLVWYRNPLPYLESKQLEEWDLMFQDDGARSHRYAPFSPNTGE